MAIPGPVFLSIIAGPLFGVVRGLLMISLVGAADQCASIGSTICYMLSQTLLKGFVLQYKRKHVIKFSALVSSYKNHIYLFMVFLRVTPMVPNPVVNLGSPLVGIPVHVFFIGTFVGLMPFNYIHVNTGLALNNISKFGASPTQLLMLAGLSFLLLLPTLLTRGKKLDSVAEQPDKKHD